MSKHVLRTGAIALGTALSLSALAAPAAAEDVVPEGCEGTVYYACTGAAAPPTEWPANPAQVVEVPVALSTPGLPLVPGGTVGGQEVGGVILPVGGQSVPGQTVTVGPVPPTDTGVVTPIQVCAFVMCIPAGTPVMVPGVPLPVVPVNVPAVTVPSETIDVPVVATVPEEQTPAVGLPPLDASATTLTVYRHPGDVAAVGTTICHQGGGNVWMYEDSEQVGRWECVGGGTYGDLANIVFDLGE
jgi:hypothetical protein